MCFFTTAAYHFSTSERTKVLRTRHVLYIFTSECAFCHSGVHFFDRRTAKSASDLTFQMCFSAQRRTICRRLTLPNVLFATVAYHFSTSERLNVQKCSEHVMFCPFSLPNVLFATAACIFSTGEQQKVLRT